MAEDSLAGALKRRRQISITVTGRRTGRSHTRPVWFVLANNALWLLPVYGSKTQWYRNLQEDRAITVQVGNEEYRLRARLVKSAAAVRKVIERFREKYTAPQIKRWYTGFDAAVQVSLPIQLIPAAPESKGSAGGG